MDEFLLGIKNHNSVEGCQKCTTTGKYCREKRRMAFPQTNVPLRTDATFRARSIPQHHRENSIIEELPINMIDDFVTSDSLHLLHLGIMKKCLLIWLGQIDNFEFKWTSDDITEMNRLLSNCNEDIASDIHRSVRNLSCIRFWKGTEFRTFLNYLGVVVLRQTLRTEEYNHFLKLYLAVMICSHEKYLVHLNLAEELFLQYFEEYIELYGINSITSNVHNLTHVVNDVRRFGSLTNIDSYVFENALSGLKLRLRTCNRPLEQISRRISELDLDYREPIDFDENVNSEPDLKYVIENNETDELHYQQISLGSDSFLSCRKFGDKWFLTKDGKIVEFHYAVKLNGKYFLNGSRIKCIENWFDEPYPSSLINVYSAKYRKFPSHYYFLDEVKAKMMCIHYEEILVFMPVLHTL